jgi:hypothetical protein
MHEQEVLPLALHDGHTLSPTPEAMLLLLTLATGF